MNRDMCRLLAAGLSAAVTASAGAAAFSFDAFANTSTNLTYRKKVIGMSGIMGITGDMSQKVTRAQFARMLVRASGYRSILTTTSNVSVLSLIHI